tara:strand:- start:49 stop:3642 length:3594 start_codon:yes stop_codon:yes gene_type:complete
MTQYIQDAEDKYFLDLKEDETFQNDLKSFFTGGRYNYSPKKIKELGVEGLADNFVEHMRFQSANETTAVKDLLYVKRDYGTQGKVEGAEERDKKFLEGKKAFGRLMSAYDVSEGGGTGKLEGIWDYGRAFASSPSTLGTLATLGFGVGSKIAAQLSSKATQLAVRSQIANLLRKGSTETAVKETFKKSLTGETLKAGIKSFAFEAPMGAGASYASNETREEVIEGYEYGVGDVAKDALIDGAIGSTLGSFFGFLDAKSTNKAFETMLSSAKDGEKTRKTALREANKTIKAANPSMLSESIEDIVEVAAIFKAKEGGVKLDSLDKDLVELGDGIRSLVLSSEINQELTTSLSLDTIKGIVGASLAVKKQLKMKPGQRVSSVLSEAIASGQIQTTAINTIKDKYNLSNEQFSYIFLSDLSRAGKVLQTGSTIKKALLNIDTLSEARLSSISSVEAEEIFKSVGGKVDGQSPDSSTVSLNVGKAVEGLRQADSLRIAYMTSQLGTTVANVGTGTFNLAVDMSDHFWKNVLRSTVGETMADGTVKKGWVKGTTSVLGGLSFDRADAAVLKDLLSEEAPLQFRNLFYETTKAMDVSGSSSLLPRIGKLMNTLNIATDSVFKEAAFYGAIDRKLKESGSSLGEFLSARKDTGAPMKLEDLPPNTLDFAVDEAKRFTFQKDYKKDKSLFGAGAKNLQKLHHKYPFLISVGMDTPFPRYIANHLEYANDYSVIGTATGGLKKLDEMVGGIFIPKYEGMAVDNKTIFGGDPYKSNLDRGARQLTGAMMVMGAYGLASEKEGKIEFDRLVQDEGGETDLSRMAGPFAINLLVGDLLYRHMNDLPLNPKASFETVREILGGVPDMSSGAFTFEFDLLKNINDSFKQGEASEGLEKQLGNMIATFTYPQTFAKDIYGQFNYDSAGNPFVRDLKPGEGFGERNFLQDIAHSNVLKNQAARFLVDMPMFSYTQSYKKGKKEGFDYKMYTPFNENPIGSWNPITKSFGAIQEPPSSDLQKEMTLLGIKSWQIYNRRTIPNPNVAHHTEYMLSQKMPQLFKSFKETYNLGISMPSYGDTTYDELGDDYEKKKFALEAFIDQTIKAHAKVTTEMFESALLNPKLKKKAIGYVRNIYAVEKAKFERSKYKDLDRVLKLFPENFEGFTTAKEYIENSGSIEDEINRRQKILSYIKRPEFDYDSDVSAEESTESRNR